jgi:hypothetical protein
MKKLFSILLALFLMGSLMNTVAQVSFSGDVQVRPRYDTKDWGDYGGSGQDMYYMLRTRLNVKAVLGGGFYAKTQLGTYNYAGYQFTNGIGPKGSQEPLAGDYLPRPGVNFNQMYLGYKSDTWGFEAGIVSLSGLSNPMLDIHFYPTRMVDIPWTIMRLATFTGAKFFVKAGPGAINFMAAKTDNGKYLVDGQDSVLTDTHDTYTFGLDYAMDFDGWKIQPAIYFTYANDKAAAPMTYGVNFSTPKFSGWAFGLNFGMTTNSVEDTDQYDGMLVRFKVTGKLGPGSLIAWYDYAKRTDKVPTTTKSDTEDIDHDYGYVWLAYKWKIASFDHGAFTIMPRWRMMTHKVTDAKDFTRNKIECLFIASFK